MDNSEEFIMADRFDLSQWKRIVRYSFTYKKPLSVLFAAAIITALLDSLFPLMSKYAIANFVEPKTINGMGLFIAAYILLGSAQALFNYIYYKNAMRVEMSVSHDLRHDLFSHVQELSLEYLNKTPVGFLLARIVSDTDALGGLFSWGISDIVFYTMYIFFALVNMFILNVKAALIVLISVPVIGLASFYFQKHMLIANRRARKQNSFVTAAYNEYINGAVAIKALDCKELINNDFSGVNGKMRVVSMVAKRIESFFTPTIMVLSSFSIAIILGMSPSLVNSGVFEVASLAAFVTYIFQLSEPIEALAHVVTRVLALQANVERINTLFDTKPTVTDSDEIAEKYGTIYEPKKENWEPVRGDIEFRNVSFRYPDSERYVLENFNLKVPAGSCIAIVGATGAGKSTLVNLVCRFFEPTSGQILIDGTDYRERSYLWLESNLSYVLQNPFLFSGSIADNIRYSKKDATMDEIIEAAKKAQAHEFITRLPDGYDTDVGQGGDKLSTGQKQLVSIARAILADGKILVMDEATSSVDTKTEQLINGMTSDLLKDRTSFIIAHRLSTIKNASFIIVVDDGKIVEMGTHSQLLRAKGLYYSMYTGQWEEEKQNEFFEKLHV